MFKKSTSGCHGPTPLGPNYLVYLIGPRGGSFGRLDHGSWSSPRFSANWCGLAHTVFVWSSPPAAGGPEKFLGTAHWPILHAGPLAPAGEKNRIFGPISAPIWLPLGDSESHCSGGFLCVYSRPFRALFFWSKCSVCGRFGWALLLHSGWFGCSLHSICLPLLKIGCLGGLLISSEFART
jgi:hypothetical protein